MRLCSDPIKRVTVSRFAEYAQRIKVGDPLDPDTQMGSLISTEQSGFGRELSIETLDLYLETKGVLFSTSPKPFNPSRL